MLKNSFLVVGLVIFVLASSPVAHAQFGPQFETWKDNPSYKQPAYPMVFVATYRDPSIGNGGNLGADVLEAGAPSRGQELWMLLPDGTTERLFPIIGVHEPLVDYSLGPTNGRINGSVAEPSVSIDGRRVYFTYFHDALNFPPFCCSTTGHSNFDGWPLGGDLYAIDLGPKIDDPTFPAGQLRVSRLTQTDPETEYVKAMNPTVASATDLETGGVVYSGALEVDTEYGRKLFFVSTFKQLKNSNDGMTKKNKNFNLFNADIIDGPTQVTINNIRQFQYYTTTSTLSPNRLRVGLAISYQSTTEENRQWAIQQLVGSKWTPLYGYGIVAEAAHLGTLCVKTTAGTLPAGDFEVVVQYYNQNNNSFGFIAAQDMSQVGLNRYDKWSSAGVGYLPEQIGSYNLTPGVQKGDYPSPVGKFTTPECGGPDELYLTYDPGPANHKNTSYQYFPEIVFTDLEPGNPGNPGNYTRVIYSPDPSWGAVWPKPLIDWSYRLTGAAHPNGKAKQQRPESVIDPDTSAIAGAPHAVFGTSSLYNTDVKPVDCKDSQGYYDPYEAGNTLDQIFKNIASLSQVMVDAPGNINAQTGSCSKPTSLDIFGIAIYLTSNKINKNHVNAGYQTGGGGWKESKALLGVFEKGMKGQSDTSFKATVPANVPVDFHLLGANGLKLADVRAWHSLKPRESRVDCGGCHNHRVGESIDWATSDSADPSVATLDMVDQTTYIDYDASCNPVLETSGQPVTEVPVWQDLSAQFHQYCGSCHEQSTLDETPESIRAHAALSYDVAKLNNLSGNGSPLQAMHNKKYIDRFSANGSRLFWAAYGARTDGRNNAKAQYQPNPPDYSNCDNNPKDCGYKFSPVHAGVGLCDGTNAVAASWVYRLGQWIDNHAPADKSGSYAYHYDRYHPTVDGALLGGSDCLHPQFFNIGFWDDGGGLAELKVEVNNATWFTVADPASLVNGFYPVSLAGISLKKRDARRVKVMARDAAGNTQNYEKKVSELITECLAAGGVLPPKPQPAAVEIQKVSPAGAR